MAVLSCPEFMNSVAVSKNLGVLRCSRGVARCGALKVAGSNGHLPFVVVLQISEARKQTLHS